MNKRPRSDDTSTLDACVTKRARLLADLAVVDARIKELTPVAAADPPRCPACNSVATQRVSHTPKNPGKAFWTCPEKCKAWIGWVQGGVAAVVNTPVPAGPVYSCARCHKTMDLGHETDRNIIRLASAVPYARFLREKMMAEYKETMESGDYTCDACLYPLKK